MQSRTNEDGNTAALLVGYAVAAAVNVLSQAVGLHVLAWITKPFLLLLLFVWAWQVLPLPKPRAGWLLLVGTLFAWLGDVLLMVPGPLLFLAGLGAFLIMQLLYVSSFLSVAGDHLLRHRRWLVLPFVAAWIGMNLLLSPGVLRVPVLVYSAVLLAMSACALDLLPRLPVPQGRRVFAGSVVFVASDGLIALDAFGGLEIGDWQGVAVMATYTVAQYLIVTGLARGLVLRSDVSKSATVGAQPVSA